MALTRCITFVIA